MEIVQ